MAASITLIKNLYNAEPNLFQLLSVFIFGDKEIREYDSTRIYNKHDLIVRYNDDISMNEILQCNIDDTTGAFDLTKWSPLTLASGGIEFKSTVPDNQSKVWYKTIKQRSINIPNSLF